MKTVRCIFLCALLALLLTVGMASAESGKQGNITWTLDEAGTLTISGTGPMVYDTSLVGGWQWIAYKDDIRAVVIESGVTDIGDVAFMNCANLTSVTLSDTVTGLGFGTFDSCTALRNIELPDSLTSISSSAFYGCSALESVELPDSVTHLGESVFTDCTSLRAAKLPANLVGTINPGLFANCTSLLSVTIPDGINKLDDGAFKNCASLTDVYLPADISSIEETAFDGCTALALHGSAGSDAQTFAKEHGIPFYADADYPEHRVYIPRSTERIEEAAFAGDASLECVVIPSGCTEIGAQAFANCAKLTLVYIPASVKEIASDAFKNPNAALVIHTDNTDCAAYTYAVSKGIAVAIDG